MNYFTELLTTLNEMSPYLLLGFLISGILHVYIPQSLYQRMLAGKGFRSVFNAALLGVPLPLCSCGVIPTAVSLKKQGASDGASVSFLISTPQTGVDSILATYSLLGLPFAIMRPIAAFLVAIFSGISVDKLSLKSKKGKYAARTFKMEGNNPESCTCGCSHHHHAKTEEHKNTAIQNIKAALNYGFIHLMQDFGKWLIIGLFIAAAITAYIPDEWFVLFKDHYMLSMLFILLISTPMYVCATGSIPIALSLMLKGISPGIAFLFLMVGSATNLAALIILKKEFGLPKTLTYLFTVILGAIACALLIDFAMPQEWFSHLTPLTLCGHEHASHEACNHGPVWWQTTTSAVFVGLFVFSMLKKYIAKHPSKD